MNVVDALSYLGRNIVKDEEARSYFVSEAIDIDFIFSVEEGYDEAGVYKSDGELYLENYEEGYCLLFKTENAVLESKSTMPLVDGDWIFSTIFVYKDGVDGYRGYCAALPNTISLNDSVVDISNKLGYLPSFENGYVKTWSQNEGYELSASSIENDKPNVVIFSMKRI